MHISYMYKYVVYCMVTIELYCNNFIVIWLLTEGTLPLFVNLVTPPISLQTPASPRAQTGDRVVMA